MDFFATAFPGVTTSILAPRQPPPQDRDGSFGQSESRVGSRGQDGCDWRMIRIGMAVRAIVNPDILFASERHQRNRPGKCCSLFSLGMLEYHVHGMRIALVAIDQHQGRVPVGTMKRVRRVL